MADTDDRLLEALERELVTPVAPSAAERNAFLAVVSDVGLAPAPRRWVRRVLTALVAGLIVSGGTTAYAVAEGLPRPVRRVAAVLHLPVDSPELVDARDALDTLEDAVDKGDRAQVDDALDDVERSLDELDRHERGEVSERAGDLEQRARETDEDRSGPSAQLDDGTADGDDSSGESDESDNRGSEPTTATTQVEGSDDDSGSDSSSISDSESDSGGGDSSGSGSSDGSGSGSSEDSSGHG